ncbi:hypothetical protein SNE40_013398 [Patella caerulea]|uniref:C2H2-type domain-containing protein n=2 Tax=Patella caerulea TaxID=87958 RepID=A0AAN8PF75_PATCE
MSSRRKSNKPTNRRSLDIKTPQVLNMVECDEESEDEQLTIPPDLFQDFLQLKSSTHLNTTQLMRKLLKEYHSQSVSGSESEHDEKNSNRSYGNNSMEPEANYEIIAESRINQTNAPDEDMDFDQPLDLTVDRTPTHSRGGSPNQRNFVANASPLTMHLPTTPMRNNNLPFIKMEPCGSVPIKTEPDLHMQVPTTSVSIATIPTHENLTEVNNQLFLNGIGNLIAMPFMPSPQMLEGVRTNLISVKAEPQSCPSPVPQVPVPPRRMKPGRKPRGGGVARPQKTQPGEMKIIAENTLFPGVYTSILKLPWSRRSRNKPPLTAKPQTTSSVGVTVQHTPVVDSSVSIPSSVLSPSTASPNPNNTLLLPASSQTIMSATTSQSVMMVYPNATISAVGKPVRRRGRPPKLPVLSHLLAEKKVKKMTAETHVTNVRDMVVPIPAVVTKAAPLVPCSQVHASSSSHPEMLSLIKTEPTSSPVDSPSQTSVPESNISSVEQNGSIYQEMLLSSKSLVNIRPRRRQSTEVKRGSDFMWTSFKIKPRGGRGTRGPDRRKKTLLTPTEPVTAEEEFDLQQTDMETDDVCVSPNMFQELFHCKICNAILPADGKIEHQREHHPMMMKCATCNTPFIGYTHKDFDVEKAKLNCEQCSKKTLTVSNGSINANGSHSISCDLCDGLFKSFHAFSDHRLKIHGNEKITLDTHSCEECGKIFFTTKGLNHHMKTHSDKSKSQAVENGSKLFRRQADELTETKEEEYDDKFQENCELEEHLHIKHSISGQNVCPWPGCEKEFTSEQDLKLHVLIHKDEKPMKCDFCEYRCRQRNALNWHMRKHPEAAYKYRKYAATLGGD